MTRDLFSLEAYAYDLPKDLIAQAPLTQRDSSRLMIVYRSTGEIRDAVFRDLKDILESGDSLVLNDTQVLPARLYGIRDSGGGRCEILLLKPQGGDQWVAMARPGRKLRPGIRVHFSERLSCEILETYPDGTKLVQFLYTGDFMAALHECGQMPLPHYIERESHPEDLERYQTVFAARPGAAAAPTAGLHFTPELLKSLDDRGVHSTKITLHVGLGTFQPVQVQDIRDHKMHTERFSITPEATHSLNNRTLNKRQIVVGTTCCRTLESACKGGFQAGDYETDIFIYPGYEFQYVQNLLTNFHFPSSTLLMLVTAFAGYDLIMEAYRKAVERRYRFFSYGDAMLIL